MFKRFISYYKPHKVMFFFDMLASFLISAVGIIYPMLTNRLLKHYIPDKNFRMIITSGVFLLGLYFLRTLMRYFVQYYGHMIGTDMQAQMRRDLFAHLETLPFSFFDNHETGKIISRITNDLFDVAELAHHGPENIIISSLSIIGSFIYLCTINVPLTLIIFACVPVMFFVSKRCRKKMRAAFKERRATTAGINAAIESSVTGIRVTKAFVGTKREYEKFETNNRLFVEASRKSYSSMATFHSVTRFIVDFFNVVILIAGGIFTYSGKIDFADYTTFVISVNIFVNPVTTLIAFTEQFQNGVSGFERFIEIMDEEPEHENPNAQDIGDVKGDIEFSHVSFSYNEAERRVLNDINLKIPHGEKIALVGHSGGGKTTICHLIPAFYRVSEGEILIDGKNINDITFSSLRKNIGIVQQDVFLFAGTVMENILYGREGATEEEAIAAAKKAKIDDFINTLPNGYNTDIGERGIRLSGGQKQRLSIARIFLKDPAILILDEATSALDNTTEIYIQSALDELCKGRTTLIVAHRLSTVRNADEIAVIDGGRVAEKGTHKELLEKGGIYKELYSLQFREDDTYQNNE